MQINYVISPYPALPIDMVARVYESQAPLAEIDNVVITAPHIAPVAVSFTGLDRIPHIVRLFTVAGTLLHNFTIEPTEDLITVFSPIFFKIGDGAPNTPLVDTNTYTNTALAGKDNTNVQVFANGALRYPGLHYDTDLSGGFHLLQVGDVFEDGTEWMVLQVPEVVATPVNDSVVAKIFGGFVDVVNVVRNYGPSDLRKLIRLSGATGSYSFTSGVDVPIGYSHTFTNFAPYGSLNDIPIINFLNGELRQGNANTTLYPLPYGSVATFTFDGTFWNLINYANTQAGVYARIVYMGSHNIGDVITQYSAAITIPTQVDTDYWIVGNLVGLQVNIDFDNDVFFTTALPTTSNFVLVCREIQGYVQNLRFDYVILRKN
jgi:hypothetical protein